MTVEEQRLRRLGLDDQSLPAARTGGQVTAKVCGPLLRDRGDAQPHV